ncbi:MAG TPA: beta-L-arabinofuranosidase domain-containing protein, partial [Anaerolineales bacterium]|nr:beta-L-arabinofuranosidase domain-containing protein [Anaerolineales bacterium]
MQELNARQVKIIDSFWSPRLAVNAQKAIFHQWKQLEATRCIDNFRLVTGEKEGFREGWFFADSDAYKWLDAASRIYALDPQPKLAALMDSFIALLGRAQLPDGYLFTYNQLHFPNQRWVNLQIEHELYCHGHLIEAGVSHFEATDRRDLLDICIKAADLLVRDFLNASNDKTCGHEEIELALMRLYRVTGTGEYLELARQFVERRGRTPFYGIHWWRERNDFMKRNAYVNQLKQEYITKHPEHKSFRLPGGNYAKKPSYSKERYRINGFLGLYTQQHAPIRKQTSPVGHAVRFGYLETAIAMLVREEQNLLPQRTQSTQRNKPEGFSLETFVPFVFKKESSNETLLSALEQAWERMVTKRMYITGGLGSAPEIEGFGGDYDLDPEYAYNETCASLASLFWNWEMALLTKNARYSDLFEWQLYNATNVGMGQSGSTYLYNNPLSVHGGVTRQGWYVVPCCPSNLSRTFADLGKYIYSFDENNIWIHQYFSNETTINNVKIKIESELPWNGKVRIHVRPESQKEFKIHLRQPSWNISSQQNGNTASAYDPRIADYEVIERVWSPDGETLEFNFDMAIKLHRAHPKVKGHEGKVAITRGPLVYCLESVDNPDIDIFTAQLDPASIRDEFFPDLFGGCVVIHASTMDGRPLRFIPYFLWA